MKKLTIVCMAVAAMLVGSLQVWAAGTSAAKSLKGKKVLVLYYSQTGATKTIAMELQSQLGADVEAIEPVKPYDGDFQATIARYQQEKQEDRMPSIKPLKADISRYDVVFLGYPVWGGTYANPIGSLLKQYSFEGKTVVTFCSFGSGGLNTSTNDVKKALPKAKVLQGYGVHNARVSEVAGELGRFLIENGYKKGKVKRLPAYSAHHPVSEAELAIFNEACSTYQFPLGTPSDVGLRSVGTTTEYEFTVSGMGGNSTIYVVVKKGAKAEFTQVVR